MLKEHKHLQVNVYWSCSRLHRPLKTSHSVFLFAKQTVPGWPIPEQASFSFQPPFSLASISHVCSGTTFSPMITIKTSFKWSKNESTEFWWISLFSNQFFKQWKWRCLGPFTLFLVSEQNRADTKSHQSEVDLQYWFLCKRLFTSKVRVFYSPQYWTSSPELNGILIQNWCYPQRYQTPTKVQMISPIAPI